MTITVEPVRDDDYDADEITVEIDPARRYAGSNLGWQLTLRVLITINPPDQGWDRYQNTYSNIGEVGAWSERVEQLQPLVDRGELAVSEPGLTSHFTHKRHLAGKTVLGEGVRALCGVYFVPTQDPEALPVCPDCQERFAELPR